MAQEFFLGVRLGVVGAAATMAAIGSARNAILRLGEATQSAEAQQRRLGQAIEQHMGRLAPRTLAALHRDYARLGTLIDAARARQDKLNQAMNRRQALGDERQRLGGEIVGAYGTALAVGAPVMKAAADTAAFGDAVKDIAIVGELTREEEAKLGQSLRRVALAVNQSAEDMARGVGLLIANGMEAGKAAQQAELLGRFTTATRASFDDAARMMVSFDQLGVSAQQMELAFSQAAKAGKLGGFEVRDMAKWFPQLGGYLKAIGVTGNEAVVNMASRLQIAMRTAGSTDEAANNFRNFLAKLTSPDTAKDFEKLGIDLQGSMLRMARQGLDPIEGAVSVILKKMGETAPDVRRELEALGKELAAIQDPAQRAAEMERRRGMIEALGARAGLGRMFQDMQAVGYLLAEIQNRDELKRIRAETASGQTADGRMALDADFDKRLESPLEQFKRLKIQLTDLGMTIGEALLPPLLSIVEAVRPAVSAFAEWARAHPGLIKGLLGAAVGMVALKAAVLSGAWALNFFVKSPLAALAEGWNALAARVLAGRLQLAASGSMLRALGAAAGLSGARMDRLGGMVARAGGMMRAALMGAGRAVLMNPIGLALTAAALLVYKFWGPIAGFFKGLWSGLKAGLAPIGASVKAAFAPVAPVLKPIGDLLAKVGGWFKGLLKPVEDTGGAAERFGVRVGQAIAGAVRLFLSLPGKLLALPGEMLRLGGEVVAGLINGIKDKLASAGKAIEELGESIKSRFKGWLGIRSPSTVFAGFGQMIGLGAAQGIAGMAGAVGQATAGLALAATAAFQPALAADVPALGATSPVSQLIALPEVPGAAQPVPALHATKPAAGATASPARAGAQAAMQITFAPVIHVNTGGNPAAVRGEVQQAMQMSFAEFERLMRRYEAERRRVSTMGGLA